MPRRLTILLVGLLLSSILAACGASAPAPTTAPQASAPVASGAPSTAPTAAGSAARQELTIAQGTDPQTLDAQRSTVQQALNISMQINEPLLYLNYQTKQIENMLATSVKDVGNNTWEVKLRPGVKFTNGEPFNAAAVKFSVERISKPELKSPALIYVRPIKQVSAVDDLTVRLTTDGPSPVLPLYLTRIAMVPPKYITDLGDAEFARKPVGTGPYKLVEWLKDERVVLQANDEYWGEKPSLSKVTFRSIPETSTRMAALKTGEVQIATQVSIDEAPALQQSGEVKVVSIPGLRLMMVQFNLLKDNALKDQRVRQALNYAVDKDALVQQVLGGYGKKLEGQPATPDYFGYNPSVKAYEYNPDKAKQLLTEAGYGPQKPLALTLYAPQGRYVRDKEIAQAIGGQLQAVGINAKVEIMDWGIYLEKLLAKELDPMMFWGASTVPDADVWITSMLGSKGAYSEWANPEFDAAAKQAGQTMDRTQRQGMYNKIMQTAHDQAPLLYLYQQVDIYGVNAKVTGFTPNPDESINLTGVGVK